MSKSKVLVMMTGSIACYKVAQVLSRLSQRQCEVQVVASPSAMQFIGNATIEGLTGRPAITDMYHSGNIMDHIHLVRWADVLLVAPATANFINKSAQGVGDDLLTTMFLAHDFKKPFLIAPAMNTAMYKHPVTQKSIQNLRDMGIEILETGSGVLACGEEGQGRLLEPDLIVDAIMAALRQSATDSSHQQEASSQEYKNTTRARILITSGGTQEPIDSVRVISNLSSGTTGKKIAENLENLGFDIFWLRAHNSQDSSWVKNKSTFTDYRSLRQQMKDLLSSMHFTHVIHLAAVSDYSVSEIQIGNEHFKPLDIPKLSSGADEIHLTLKKNPKIINELKSWSQNKNLKVIAFKLTSKASVNEKNEAVIKLQQEAQTDYVVQNDLSEIDIQNGKHIFNFFTKDKVQTCNGVEELLKELNPVLTEEIL